jgi:hypothetical protein
MNLSRTAAPSSGLRPPSPSREKVQRKNNANQVVLIVLIDLLA